MIGFLHPWVLAGLAAAAIPILLHLLARREPPTVVFPAVRYLVTTTQEHHRRLKLQNWLLLFLRTLLVATLVMAAAGPTVPMSGVPGHSPSALVLIIDNSPSSGAMTGGSPQLGQLVAAGRRVLARATPEDALWLITADGIPRRGDRVALSELLGDLAVSPRRLELGAAITLAGEILGSEHEALHDVGAEEGDDEPAGRRHRAAVLRDLAGANGAHAARRQHDHGRNREAGRLRQVAQGNKQFQGSRVPRFQDSRLRHSSVQTSGNRPKVPGGAGRRRRRSAR